MEDLEEGDGGITHFGDRSNFMEWGDRWLMRVMGLGT